MPKFQEGVSFSKRNRLPLFQAEGGMCKYMATVELALRKSRKVWNAFPFSLYFETFSANLGFHIAERLRQILILRYIQHRFAIHIEVDSTGAGGSGSFDTLSSMIEIPDKTIRILQEGVMPCSKLPFQRAGGTAGDTQHFPSWPDPKYPCRAAV